MSFLAALGLKSSAPLISGAISGAMGLLGQKGSKRRNQEAQTASAKQMAFQERMSNTSYQRGMEDMRKAGLNPILAGKVGGASTPTGSTYNPENTVIPGINAALQTQQTYANVQQTEAQTAKILAETDVINKSQGSFVGRNFEYFKKEVLKILNSSKDLKDKEKAINALKLTNRDIYKDTPYFKRTKSKSIKSNIKRSGSKTIYKGKTLYPDRIMRTKK